MMRGYYVSLSVVWEAGRSPSGRIAQHDEDRKFSRCMRVQLTSGGDSACANDHFNQKLKNPKSCIPGPDIIYLLGLPYGLGIKGLCPSGPRNLQPYNLPGLVELGHGMGTTPHPTPHQPRPVSKHPPLKEMLGWSVEILLTLTESVV